MDDAVEIMVTILGGSAIGRFGAISIRPIEQLAVARQPSVAEQRSELVRDHVLPASAPAGRRIDERRIRFDDRRQEADRTPRFG